MMNYPVILQSFTSDLHLYIPDPQKIQSVYEQRKKLNPEIDFPFWAKCWPSSLAMLSFLQNHPNFIQDKIVLELGAGIGLPSFYAAKLASSVVITDYAKEAIELLHYNIAELKISNAKAFCFDWNDCEAYIPAEVIMLSDVNYDEKDFYSLKLRLHPYLQKGVTILLATPYRINAGSFVTEFSQYVQQQELVTINTETEDVLIGLFVMKKDRK